MRDRTADLLRAKQALSQLSYGPDNVVGLGRFELPTSPLSGVRSNQLSYRPMSVSLDQIICVGNSGRRSAFVKEVIQPQVPLRLPCDDLTLLTEPKFDVTKRLRLT